MHKFFGILIRPETHTVHDVEAYVWTDHEMRQRLEIGNDEIARREVERTGDAIFVSAFLNGTTAGKSFRSDGFDLYGDRYYGPALIIAARESGVAPVLDPHDISRAIHFFRMNEGAEAVERF